MPTRFLRLQKQQQTEKSRCLGGLHPSRRCPTIVAAVCLTPVALGCLVTTPSYWRLHSQHEAWTTTKAIQAVVEHIIGVESDGDPNAKNKRSSATGLGQFLDETWLDMIRAHRPDLAKGRSQAQILELRRDAGIAREITARFTERNAELLSKRGLAVTPGTLYLLTLLVGQGQWRSCRQRMRPMPPLLWRARTRPVERSEKKSSRQIPSSKASRSLILGIGRTAKCAFLVYKCLARRG